MRLFFKLTALILTTGLAGCQITEPARQPIAGSSAAPSEETIAPSRTAAPDVLFYLGTNQPIQGLTRVVLSRGDVIWLAPQPVLTRGDLQGVAPVRNDEGKSYLSFLLNEAGARKLADVTSRNTGALLSLVIGQTLHTVSIIGEPITEGILRIPVANEAQAVGLVNAILGQGTNGTPR